MGVKYNYKKKMGKKTQRFAAGHGITSDDLGFKICPS